MPPIELRFSSDLLYTIASDSQDRGREKIQREVLERNPGLVAFDILRERDDITLIFGFRVGEDQADFRLLGEKLAYYRLSMGVRLDETLDGLTQADPNIGSAGVEKRDGELAFKIDYAWPEGTGPKPSESPPVATSPTMSKPQPAPPERLPKEKTVGSVRQTETKSSSVVPAQPSPPPGAEVEVSVPTPKAPPLLAAEAKVTEREAPTPAAEPAPATPTPSGKEQVERAYREVLQDGRLQALVRFIDKYPDSPQASELRGRVDRMREDAAYRQALERDDPAGYRAFLEHFPESQHRGEVNSRLELADKRRRRAEAERRSRAAQEKRRQDAYSETRKLDTPAAYRIFLTAYPDAPEAKNAKQRLEALEADDAAFRKAMGSEQDLETYLATYPKGRHTEQVQAELRKLRASREEADYAHAVATGTPEALEEFLAKWPQSSKTVGVRAARGTTPDRETGPHSPSASAGAEAATLVVSKVSVPPVVDGVADDKAWGRATVLEVPLRASADAQAVRVRAVHDGTTLYLLAEWDDASHDALYRPWVWDPEHETYHQNEQVDDALALALYRNAAPADPCMLKGFHQEADVWVWRAHWSEISGRANDGLFQVSRSRIPQSNPYPAADGAGQLWIRQTADEGSPGWSFFIPVDFQGDVIPSYRPADARGSRSDVQARGSWSSSGTNKGWVVEIARSFDTGNPDDVVLRNGSSQPVAFAVFDKSEKSQHSTSPLVRLEIEEH